MVKFVLQMLHRYKLFKGCSRVITHKYFLSNRIIEICNALPSAVVEASSSIVFKRKLDCVDLAKYCLFSFLFVYFLCILCDFGYTYICM